MKYRPSTAIIAIYSLFTFLWLASNISASESKYTNIIPELLEHNIVPLSTKKLELRNAINKTILSIILKHFLTIQDILILRKTCKDFEILLRPNGQNMVLFSKNFGSKTITEAPLAWFDLKYFLNTKLFHYF